jgi:hypothetical protein
MITCDLMRSFSCKGYPMMCSTCKHNTTKKNYYEPDTIPNPHYNYTYPCSGPLPFRFKDHYTILCSTPLKITMPKTKVKK